jgi:transcriptional regulator with XRE-family HTH domain
MDFSKRLKQLRNEKGFTQVQIAAEFGKGEAAIRTWETGKAKPDCDTLIKLSKYFNCTTDYLLGLSETRNEEERGKAILIQKELSESYGSLPDDYKLKYMNISEWLLAVMHLLLEPEESARISEYVLELNKLNMSKVLFEDCLNLIEDLLIYCAHGFFNIYGNTFFDHISEELLLNEEHAEPLLSGGFKLTGDVNNFVKKILLSSEKKVSPIELSDNVEKMKRIANFLGRGENENPQDI